MTNEPIRNIKALLGDTKDAERLRQNDKELCLAETSGDFYKVLGRLRLLAMGTIAAEAVAKAAIRTPPLTPKKQLDVRAAQTILANYDRKSRFV